MNNKYSEFIENVSYNSIVKYNGQSGYISQIYEDMAIWVPDSSNYTIPVIISKKMFEDGNER